MADSSEKVSFRVDMQCSSLRAEAFLVFEKGSQPTHRQQITDMRPTVGRLLAEDFRKSGKRQSAEGDPKSRNRGTTESRKMTPNPKTRNHGK